jgi:DUF4097 and DUF4098 domain-containing protein YvlB
MNASKWERFKGRIAPTTVQQLLDHTEEIDQQIEKVLVGLYNDMTDHRAKVAAVSSKLEEAGNFSQTIQKLDRTNSDLTRRVVEIEGSLTLLTNAVAIARIQIRRIYFILAVQLVAVLASVFFIATR